METTDVTDGEAGTHGSAPPLTMSEVPTERLEAEICTEAGQLAAMECRWLLKVAEFDRRRGFDAWEARSTAHWLTWKCGMSSRTAHEKVRIALRLDELPLVTAAFAAGELSYSKVRAISRIAVPATEADLVEIARHATGAQIERLAAGRRKVDRLAAERDGEGDPGHSVRWWHDDEGAVIIKARLPAESGALVIKALEAAIDDERAVDEPSVDETIAAAAADAGPTENPPRKCSAEHSDGDPARPSVPADAHDTGRRSPENDSEKCSAEHSSDEDPAREPRSAARQADPPAGDGNRSQKCSAEHSSDEKQTKAQTAVDALVSMADAYLAHPERIRTGGDRYTGLFVLEHDTFTGDDPHGTCVLDDGTAIEPETARRLACDCARQPIIRRPDGSLLDAGHQTRTVNRATRRALHIRDGGCVFPGCGRTRWVDAHHIVHWADHGPTRPDNLVLLCRHHHRAVHEGGYTISGNPQQGTVRFRRPDGTVVNPHCASVSTSAERAEDHLRADDPGLQIDPATITGHYVGDPLDLYYAVGCLIDTEQPHDHRDYQVADSFPSPDSTSWRPDTSSWQTVSEPFSG